MRVYGHYTNAPPFGNDFPLGSWHHLKTALSSTLGNANPHILIKCFQKTSPNTPNAAHLGQNDAPERPHDTMCVRWYDAIRPCEYESMEA